MTKLYLSKALMTKYVVIRILLKHSNKKKQGIAILTNPDYTKQIKNSH